jgi:predicted dinucleotide-binding enzyme
MARDDDTPSSRRAFIGFGAALAAAAAMPRTARAAAPPGATPIPIGIIGSGHIGGTVGSLWVKAGHPVMFSSRQPDELKDLVAGLGKLAQAGTPAQAAAFGTAVLIAVPYKAMPQIGRDLDRLLAGKVVLDATNAVVRRDGTIASDANAKGIGLASAGYLPSVRLVRAFNTMSYRILASEAHRATPEVAIPIAGDDPGAVAVAAGLIRDAGFEPVVIGKLAAAKEFALGTPLAGEHTAAQLHQILASQH